MQAVQTSVIVYSICGISYATVMFSLLKTFLCGTHEKLTGMNTISTSTN